MARGPERVDCAIDVPAARRDRRGSRAGGVVLAPTEPVPATVLVIADRLDIAALMGRCLAGLGLRPLVATDVRQAALLMAREMPAAAVLDLAAPGHYDAVVHWLRRDPARHGMAIVQVSTLARNGGVPRNDARADVRVPKPFTPKHVADAVRVALARKSARERLMPAPYAGPPVRVGASRPIASSQPVAAACSATI
jgi:DNA-binding response OmpR family regulator